MPKHWTLKIKGKRINMDRNLLTRWQSHIGLTNLGGRERHKSLFLKIRKDLLAWPQKVFYGKNNKHCFTLFSWFRPNQKNLKIKTPLTLFFDGRDPKY